MNSELLALVRCPNCRGAVECSDESNSTLRCRECGASFPIVGGVPRLAGEGYSASFGRQWNRYDVQRIEEDESIFQTKTGMRLGDLGGLRILDAGCGGGRYSALAGNHGGRVVGVDLSSAVDKAAALCRELPNVLILQGDLLNVPAAEASFDLVFSIGVLHHTPDARRAFAQIARRVRPGGRLSVWLYRKNTPPQEWLNSAVRAVTTRTPARVLEPLCAGLGALGSVPAANRLLNKVVNFSNHPDWTLRVCDNFDWYAPKYQSHHTIDELKSWFAEEGFGEIAELPPAKSGRLYDWAYQRDLIIGSGVNATGIRT